MAVEDSANRNARPNAVQIIYASETGTAASVSSEMRTLLSTQLPCTLRCISAVGIDDLRSIASPTDNSACLVIFVVATAGDGEVPRSMRTLWRALLRNNLSRDILSGLRVAILGLGDTSYAKFNAVARRLRARLADLGAHEYVPAVLADDSATNGPDQAIDEFTDTVARNLGIGSEDMQRIRTAQVPPRARLRILPPSDAAIHNHRGDFAVDAWGNNEAAQKDGWVDATVVVNEPLTDGAFLDDDRQVRRVVFDASTINTVTTNSTTEENNFHNLLRDFRAGDVLELRPRNRASAVDAFLSLTGFSGDVVVEVADSDDDASHLPVVFPCRLDSLVAAACDLGGRVRPRFLARLSAYATVERERDRLRDLCSVSMPEFAEEFAAYAVNDMRTPLMVLRDFPSARPPLDALIDMLPPLRPRAYSIAGISPRIEICAAVARFVTPLRFSRVGIASATILRAIPGDIIPIRILPGPRPETGVPAILVAAGAGAAFVRPLAHLGSDSLMFFGCRNRRGDFLYGKEWEELRNQGKLVLHTAFSRTGKERVYVQDRIRQCAEQVWEWISKKNAHVYVSGHAGAYAREVRRAIVDTISTQGLMEEKSAEKLVRKMEKNRSLIFECW